MHINEEKRNRMKSLYKKFKTKMWVAGAVSKEMFEYYHTDDEFKTLNIRHKSVMDEVTEVLGEMRNIRLEEIKHTH